MANELGDFRLESYEERSVLLSALDLLRAYRPEDYNTAIREALALRLSRTKCQPGGCEYCDADAYANRYIDQWED